MFQRLLKHPFAQTTRDKDKEQNGIEDPNHEDVEDVGVNSHAPEGFVGHVEWSREGVFGVLKDKVVFLPEPAIVLYNYAAEFVGCAGDQVLDAGVVALHTEAV